jgi:hypothetical protein
MGAGCVSSETGAQNECAGGAMKNAKEKARGLLRRPASAHVVQDLLSRYSDDVEPSQASHSNGRKDFGILTHRSQQLEMANETVRNPLGEGL